MIYNSFNLNDYNIDKISYQLYLAKKSSTEKKRDSLQNILKRFVPKRAGTCLLLYYYKNKSMKDISKILGISIATVSRDINNAKSIIEKHIYF